MCSVGGVGVSGIPKNKYHFSTEQDERMCVDGC